MVYEQKSISACRLADGAKTETWLENSWRRSDNIVGDLEENYDFCTHAVQLRAVASNVTNCLPRHTLLTMFAAYARLRMRTAGGRVHLEPPRSMC